MTFPAVRAALMAVAREDFCEMVFIKCLREDQVAVSPKIRRFGRFHNSNAARLK
jgi:hypothetical protein